MGQPDIHSIVNLLEGRYGPRQLHPHHQPLAELVQTILSQNTSDMNSRPAFRELMHTFDSWEKLLQADVNDIAEVISSGGLGQVKALRIQQALKGIKQRRGSLDLNFLNDMPVPEAREWLKQLPGVGDKTANCVLLFALGKPALPVDTHIFRLSRRLKLISEKASLEEAHRILGGLVPPDKIFQFHVLMIEHGRQVCLSQRPRCGLCILKELCPAKVSHD